VGHLRASAAAETAGVEAEALWALATDTTEARIAFDATGEAGDIELLLLRRREEPLLHETAARARTALTNDPLTGDVRRALASRVRRDLTCALPDYLVPARIVVVDALPLTPSGKGGPRRALDATAVRPHACQSAGCLDGMQG